MERDDAEVVEEGSGGRTRHRLRRGLLQGLVGVGLIVGLVYISVNFVIDVIYGFVDPRVRVG